MNDPEFIMSRFDYSPDTGVLSWKAREDCPAWWNTRYAGTIPSATDSLGYIRAKITYQGWSGYVSVHRICYLMHHGDLPDVIDHIDGDVKNNRIANLRSSNSNQNRWNSLGNKDTITGLKGVNVIKYTKGPRKGEHCGYAAHIGHNGKREYLGFFRDAESAGAAYLAREKELREEYARSNCKA